MEIDRVKAGFTLSIIGSFPCFIWAFGLLFTPFLHLDNNWIRGMLFLSLGLSAIIGRQYGMVNTNRGAVFILFISALFIIMIFFPFDELNLSRILGYFSILLYGPILVPLGGLLVLSDEEDYDDEEYEEDS